MITGKVDDSQFRRALSIYLDETSKESIDAVNFKLFDATRAAIKGTVKADRNTVRETLNAMSNKHPARTVAEMLVIKKSQESGEEINDLKLEAQALINKRYSSLGFAKAGWLPALRELLPKIKRESVSISGVSVKENKFGGAKPAYKFGGQIVGSTFNDVDGTGNKDFVNQIKEQGAQVGVDKVTHDIAVYLQKKLGIPIEKFNRS